jgi:hypothetical protein
MPLNNTKRCDKDRSIHAKRGVAILNRRIINIGKDYGLRMHGCELRKDQCGTEWYSRRKCWKGKYRVHVVRYIRDGKNNKTKQ